MSTPKIDLRLGDIKESLPDGIIEAINTSAKKEGNLYPRNYQDLVSKLSTRLKVPKNQILLVNGVDGAIDLITRALAQRVLYVEPTYYEFRAAPERNGIPTIKHKISEICDKYTANIYRNYHLGRVLFYDLMSRGRHTFYGTSLDDATFKEGTVFFLCNPNNPFGEINCSFFYGILKRSKGYIALDETYADFSESAFRSEGISMVKDYQNLIVMRSFSKSHRMAGLRIGYIVAQPNIIKKLEDAKVFFDVSSTSVAAAIAALDYENVFKQRDRKIKQRRNSLEKALTDAGFNVIPSDTNNLIIHFETEPEAKEFVDYLAKQGVVVNQGDGISTTGLDNTWIRFNCGTEEQATLMEELIKSY